MKFTDGYWQLRPGVEMLAARDVRAIDVLDDTLVALASTKVIRGRGDTLNTATLTVTIDSPAQGVARVRVEHFVGPDPQPWLPLPGATAGAGTAAVSEGVGIMRTGDLTVRMEPGPDWQLVFERDGQELTRCGPGSLAHVRANPHTHLDGAPVGNARERSPGLHGDRYMLTRLQLGVGEHIYGLGERFGPVVKNGQTIDIWNADGGTSSEQAYKNVPFYLSDRGYGVLVCTPGHVSYEVGSEQVEKVQFSVGGESIEFCVIDGGTPAEVLQRYTALVGRPADVPAWSYGLWLTTSFTTEYDEATVSRFIDGMAERDIPLSVFHFDCFWMREFTWCDFTWDPGVFPDPEGMLGRLHDRGLRVCVWINPYIAQRSPLFAEAAAAGYLVQRADGRVWQWDLWQAGMGLVDFTNPSATVWFQDKLRPLMAGGVDCFKTDFGERIPLDVVYHDGSDPERMHNWYTQLYNKAVFDVLEQTRGAGDAVVFARSATVGGQQMPVHWGGDSTSTFESMAETLRGGLSLAYSGFGFWSHDIGGFEGSPDPAVFKRWVAFGMLSSHSRLHGSGSYRVPWLFDDGSEPDGQSAVEVMRRFAQLKLRILPYLVQAGHVASATGLPVMRPMLLEFPDDRAVTHLDRQYMLGTDLLVAPVMSPQGVVDLYLPAGNWTDLWTGTTVVGGGWRREEHGFDSLPLYVREGAVIPIGAHEDNADYDLAEGVRLDIYPGAPGVHEVFVPGRDGDACFIVRRGADDVHVSGPGDLDWSARLVADDQRSLHLERQAR